MLYTVNLGLCDYVGFLHIRSHLTILYGPVHGVYSLRDVPFGTAGLHNHTKSPVPSNLNTPVYGHKPVDSVWQLLQCAFPKSDVNWIHIDSMSLIYQVVVHTSSGILDCLPNIK